MIHPASLVDSKSHSGSILELVDVEIDRQVIDYVVDSVQDTVDYAMGRPSSSSISRGRTSAKRSPMLTKFSTFATNVITRAEVTMPTLLGALVYIDRARPHLHIALEEWALERVFLGALMVASKYLNDSTLKNVHWALCTGVFGKRDVGRIEREFLDVLDFELSITESDILSHHDGIMSAVSPVVPHVKVSSVELDVVDAMEVDEVEEIEVSPRKSQRHSHLHTHPRHQHSHRRTNSASSTSSTASSVPSLSPSSPSSSSSSISSPATPPAAPESRPVYKKGSALDTLLRAFPSLPGSKRQSGHIPVIRVEA